LVGLVAAWCCYPAANRFSILRCTISFLGSPDADRNPDGWRFYQAGMTALVVLLGRCAAERHRRLRPRIGRAAAWSSGAMFLALVLLLLVVWIPDTRRMGWLGRSIGHWHTSLAILAIPFLAGGIALDGVALWWSGVRWRALWPFHLYGLLMLIGWAELSSWERMCQRDASLRHWPGDGLHSTPLWEWIGFTCLIAFLIWMAHGRRPAPEKKRSAPECASDRRFNPPADQA
jgi:hypothetical protein